MHTLVKHNRRIDQKSFALTAIVLAAAFAVYFCGLFLGSALAQQASTMGASTARRDSRSMLFDEHSGPRQIGVSSRNIYATAGQDIYIKALFVNDTDSVITYRYQTADNLLDCRAVEVSEDGTEVGHSEIALPSAADLGSGRIGSFLPHRSYEQLVSLTKAFNLSKPTTRFFKFGVRVFEDEKSSPMVWSPVVKVIVMASAPDRGWHELGTETKRENSEEKPKGEEKGTGTFSARF